IRSSDGAAMKALPRRGRDRPVGVVGLLCIDRSTAELGDHEPIKRAFVIAPPDRHAGLGPEPPPPPPSPLLIKLAASLSAALPFRLSGRVRAPSRRRAARDSTASCASVSLPVSSFSPVMEVLLAVCSGLLPPPAAAPQSAHRR